MATDETAGEAAADVAREPTELELELARGSRDGTAARRIWELTRVPVVLFAKVYALLFAVSWLSIELLSRHPSYTKPPAVFRGTNFLEGWARWDGNWYQLIVDNGYFFTPGQQSSVAFFPAYPLTVKALNVVTRDVWLTSIVVSLLAGLVAVTLFYRWCARQTSPATARLAVMVLILYPYAWYLFGATYADSVFLAATIGAFVLLERDQPIWAGVAGIVATAARPVGVGVIIGLVAVMVERRQIVVIPAVERIRSDGWKAWRRSGAATENPSDLENPSRGVHTVMGLSAAPRRLRARDTGVLLAPLGLTAWTIYLWRNWGNPLLFAETEGAPGWDQAAGPRTWLKVELFDKVGSIPKWIHDTIWPLDVRGYDPWTYVVYTLGITFQATLVLGALALVPRVLRRLGWGYVLYVLSVVGIPILGSKDFQGAGRYMLAAFPCFFVVAEWLHERERLRRVVLPVSAILLVVLTSLFARGFYVA